MRRRSLCSGMALSMGVSLSLSVSLLAADPPGAVGAPGGVIAPGGTVEFSRDVRPILSDKCFACHGPDEKERKARLRLDTEEGAFRERRGRSPIVPGDPESSELYRRLIAEDEDDRMPPVESGKSLTPAEIARIRKWIEEGAEWQGHWAFVPPARPALPPVTTEGWVRNEIDRFILARLEAESLEPSPEADRRTLIRRVTFDLTGLPPAPEEADAFVNDPSPDAYEKLVERLLRSPRYGEHMARYWLDSARYGDTHGLHLDNLRIMWPYRDWVIRAFNENMPFDQFTIEQLAGDLLPNPTTKQRIATGFNRCNVTTSEGGSIDEEYYVRYAVDRVETTSTVFMGLTAGCAVCHDHKFDPLPQKEFYQLFAYFNNITEPAMDGNASAVRPYLEVPLPGVPEKLEKVRAAIAAVEEERRARAREAEGLFAEWLARAQSEGGEPVEMPSGLLAHFPLDGTTGEEFASTVEPERKGRIHGKVALVEGRYAKAIRFEGGHVDLGDLGDFEGRQPFSYGAWIRTPGNVTGAPIARMDPREQHRGWDLYLIGRRVAMHLIHRWPEAAIKVTTREEVLDPDRWHHVFIAYDGSGAAAGVKVYVDGKERPHEVNNDSLGDHTARTKVPLFLGKRHTDSLFQGGAIDELRLYGRCLSAAEVAVVAGSDPIAPLLAIAPSQRSPEETAVLRRHFLETKDSHYKALTEKLARLEGEKAALEKETATTLVMEERETPRGAYVLYRGQYDQRREQVEPGVPAFLPPLPEGVPPNRLGFAKWLVDPAHPLTARVFVNRLWQQKFGAGIVKTAEDFGSQGEPPSHSRLLDWLAVEFIESGWNIHHMHRLMVTSATYRQSSRVRPELRQKDPENRLLARGPRFRLDAEVLRDQALATSGLLVKAIGGPSVKPPQPPGLWYAVGYTSSNTARFQQDTGENIYRRSLYTFWKRTSPPPTMTTFDAPSRESCTVRRERTNTPLQALVLLNETQFVESARHLAQRTLREGGTGPEERARWMFLRVLARPPSAEELEELLDAFRDLLGTYREDPEAATALIRVGDSPPDEALDPVELAAWTMVANLILNLDEAINKG